MLRIVKTQAAVGSQAARMWNDSTPTHQYAPATNLADLLGRSAAADYFNGSALTRLLPHNNCERNAFVLPSSTLLIC